MIAFIRRSAHISEISVGAIVEHEGVIRTVSQNYLKRDSFIGVTLYGDSYLLGQKPVLLWEYQNPLHIS